MRLISCHIENFGRLHDFSYNFDQNINTILEENGWGKSTLAAFLRIMFFGLQNESKRNDVDNDRRRYRPWQGGVFGGSLTFTVHGKTYIVTRQFKDKEAEDFFELRNADTNMISNDYSKNLGEEIFSINSDSFMRSVFISQNDCVTFATDSINAKIGNITDNTGDIDSFENANEILKKYLRDHSPSLSRGLIRQLKDEKSDLYRDILDENNVEEAINLYDKRIKEYTAELENVREKKSDLKDQDDKSRQMEAIMRIQDNYDILLAEEAAAKEEVSHLEEKFPIKVLSREDLERIRSLHREYEKNRLIYQGLSFTDKEVERLEELLSVNLQTKPVFPEEDEQRLSILEREFGSSENYFDDASKLTLTFNEYQRKEREVKEKEEYFSKYSESNIKKKAFPFLILLGVLLLLGAGVAFVSSYTTYAYILAGISVISFILHFPLTKLLNKNSQDSVSELLQYEINASKDSLFELREEMYDLCYRHGIEVINEDFYSAISKMNSLAREYDELRRKKESLQLTDNSGLINERDFLLQKKESINTAKIKLLDSKNELDIAIKDMGYQKVEDYHQFLEQLLIDITSFEKALINLRNRSQKRASYYEENNVGEILSTNYDVYLDPKLIKEEMDKLLIKEEELLNLINKDRFQLKGLCEKSDELIEKKQRFSDLEGMIAKESEKYRLVEKAQALLVSSKEKLTNEYTMPLLTSFKHYYQIVTGNSNDFFMDANSNLTVDEYGIQRNIFSLSQGLKDLIGVCLRIAFIDAMYPSERPVIFLDDPFVNLDDGKIHGARELLEEISTKYQIIYFTCNKTRA